MQDEVNTKVVAIAIKGGKITAEVLDKALKKFVEEIEKAQKTASQPKTYRGKQSIKHLVAQNAAISNIEVTDGNIKSFQRTANKYGIDYKAIAFDYSIHSLEGTEVFAEKDFNAQLMCNAKRISCSQAIYKVVANFREICSSHRSTSIRGNKSIAEEVSNRTDLFRWLFALPILLGSVLLILRFGDPIGIIECFHCAFQSLFTQTTTGKKTGHFAYQLINISGCSRAALLVSISDISSAAAQQVFCGSSESICNFLDNLHMDRLAASKLIILNCTRCNSGFLSEFYLSQTGFNPFFFQSLFETHKAPLSLIFREHEHFFAKIH